MSLDKWSLGQFSALSEFSEFCGWLLCVIRICDSDAVPWPYVCSVAELRARSIVDRLPGYARLFFGGFVRLFVIICYLLHLLSGIGLFFFFNTGWKIFLILCFQAVPCQLSLLFSTFFLFFGLTFPLAAPFSFFPFASLKVMYSFHEG